MIVGSPLTSTLNSLLSLLVTMTAVDERVEREILRLVGAENGLRTIVVR